MANYLLRMQLPDRAGALGAVASRIGALRGSVASIEILQRDDGEVTDELGVELGEEGVVDLMVAEILEVDGVRMEAVRPVDGPVPDRHAEVLDTARGLFQQDTPDGVIAYVTRRVRASLAADYAVALDPARPGIVAGDGALPEPGALHSLTAGVLAAGGADLEGGLAWAVMPRAELAVVVARQGLAIRELERDRLETVVELADHRWRELAQRAGATTGGSGGGPAA